MLMTILGIAEVPVLSLPVLEFLIPLATSLIFNMAKLTTQAYVALNPNLEKEEIDSFNASIQKHEQIDDHLLINKTT